MMRKFLIRVGCASLIAIGAVWVPLQTAHAARTRPLPRDEKPLNPTPSTPEPAAAIVFGLGVGLVAWRVQRSRRDNK